MPLARHNRAGWPPTKIALQSVPVRHIDCSTFPQNIRIPPVIYAVTQYTHKPHLKTTLDCPFSPPSRDPDPGPNLRCWSWYWSQLGVSAASAAVALCSWPVRPVWLNSATKMVSYESAKETTKYLVHWENPPASAGVLSAILAVFVSICYFSFIAVIAYISLAVLLIIMGIKVYSFAMVFMKKVTK